MKSKLPYDPTWDEAEKAYLISKRNKNMKTREQIHDYWKHPDDGRNSPESYLEGTKRSEFLYGLIQKCGPVESILELGCNVGRNLNYLYERGYKDLTGVEINESAILSMYDNFKEMANNAKIAICPIEQYIGDYLNFNPDKFDLIFTMAVFEHLHPQSDWIFTYIPRMTDYLITIEDEVHVSNRHFPRNYKVIFEKLWMKQVYEENCERIPGLGKNFMARIFK